MEKKTHLYFPINKCGNTTFKKVFKSYEHILIPNLNINNDKNNNLYLLKPTYNLYYKFTIIRHPIQRFLSAVNMFIRDNKMNKETAINDVIKIMKTNDTYSLSGSNANYIKRHTLPLTHNLYCLIDENDHLNVDLVIRLESLKNKEKLEFFFNKIKINPNTILPIENKTEKYIKFSDLNKDNLQFLNSYYEKDFRFFDYEK